MSAFDKCLACILKHEGGYVNHPRDPGGITNLGVTKKTWEAWAGKSATVADMKALTVAKVSPLYRERYWEELRCGDIPPALALCVFDFGVNAGPARAARYLQNMVGADPDGQIGRVTLEKAQAWIGRHGVAEAVRRYQQQRRDYYRRLKTFPTFGKGWLRRVDEVETEALRMIP